ncbi:MAG: SpaA isopeptide-forming pilin-related protein [Acidobacteriota bacterium]|nr:SpaA isopeptide-forming pilin-related protein [Acidobacteriota bacterium]
MRRKSRRHSYVSLLAASMLALTLAVTPGSTWADEPTPDPVSAAEAVTESSPTASTTPEQTTASTTPEQTGDEDVVTAVQAATPRASATCSPGQVYVVASAPKPGVGGGDRKGQVLQVTSGGTVSKFGPALSDSQMFQGDGNSSDPVWNSLAVTPDGSKMYVIARTKQQQARVWAYDGATNSWGNGPVFDQNIGNAQTGNGFGGFLLAGAVHPVSGNFVYGGYDTGAVGTNAKFMLWSLNPSTGTNTYVGYVAVKDVDAGDIAFDAQGNLYLLSGTANSTDTYIYAVTKEHYNAASGGEMIASKSAKRSFVQNANGVALDANGSIYVTASTAVFKGDLPDMPTATSVTSNMFAGLELSNWSSNDATSCSFPPIIQLQKSVVGRHAATDQFFLSLAKDASTLGETTTAGTKIGVQDQLVGPFPTSRGVTFNFTENSSGTTNLGDYATSYVCAPENDPTRVLASGTTTSGSLTYPSDTSINSVVCTFTNTPLLIPVTVKKTVLDVNGANPQPGYQWSLGMSTTGAASQNPSAESQLTPTDGIVNWTVRLPNASATVDITVSEQEQYSYSLVTDPANATECVVTHADGSITTTALTSTTGNLTGVKAGDQIACGFTNRLKPAYLTLVKVVDNPQEGTGYAEPSDWTLTAAGGSGSSSASTVTGVSGTADVTHVQVIPGFYDQLSETSPLSDGYRWTDLNCVEAGGDTTIGFMRNVDQLGVITGGSFNVRGGNDITCTYTNTPKPGSAVWQKADEKGAALAGSEWSLTGPGVSANTVVTDCTQATCPTGQYTDQDPTPGRFKLADLVWGEYTLTESKAPAGYLRDTTEHVFTISHDNLDQTFGSAFENVARESPELPLTGGQSAALFSVLGGGLLAAALALASTRRRRPLNQDA